MFYRDNSHRVFFVVSSLVLFALLAIAAPAARSQQTPVVPVMTVSHRDEDNHFSLVDLSKSPTPTGTPKVGKFVSSTNLGSFLSEGHAFPTHVDPAYLYGFVEGGAAIQRVSQSGAAIGSTDLSASLSSIRGACLVQKNVPFAPQWIPSAYDLKDHYVVVGGTSVTGYSSGMMLIDPATMVPFQVGLTNQFLLPDGDIQDVCFAVYAGMDGSHGTLEDNEYRYVGIYSSSLQETSGLFCLSLNKHESTNSEEPQDPYNPKTGERGPSYPNAIPQMSSNAKFDSVEIASVNGSPLHCKAYYARPGLANFSQATDKTYVIAGWVQVMPGGYSGTVIRGFSLGGQDPLVAVTPITGPEGAIPAPNDGFGFTYAGTTQIFGSMTVVGDWLICGVGAVPGGPGAAGVQAVYIPEFLDGPADGDNGVRDPYFTPGASSRASYHPVFTGHPGITYLGSGPGQDTIYACTRNAFQNHTGMGLLQSATPISMHTDEEQLIGLMTRLDPQPFVGFLSSLDPAENFSSSGDGGGGGGGCGGSASGSAGAAPGLLALAGMAFLLNRILRECR